MHNQRSQSNTEPDFWHHVDRSGGPTACWPWLPTKLTPQGRARFRFEGKMRDAHVILFFLLKGEWLRRYDIAPCPELQSCCNPAHIKRRDIDHKKFANDIMQQQSRLQLFTKFLTTTYPELLLLDKLIGDKLPDFLAKYEGRTIQLRMPSVMSGDEAKTITIAVPGRAELSEVARAFDCHSTMSNALPRDLARISAKLQNKYNCSVAEVACYNEAGTTIINTLMPAGRFK